LLEAFFLEYELIEVQISESSGEFLKLLQGNLPEHLGRTSMLTELVCIQFQPYFQDCYEVFKHLPNHCIIGKKLNLSILRQRGGMICQDLARGMLKEDIFAFNLRRTPPLYKTHKPHLPTP